MPKPISNEERDKVVKHKKNGETNANIAKWLFISESAVAKIWGAYQNTYGYHLKYKNCGRKSAITAEQESKIIAKIKETPDITLNEMIDFFELKITESGLSKWLTRRGYSFKKRLLIRKNKIAKKSKKSGKNL
jgi:transposase